MDTGDQMQEVALELSVSVEVSIVDVLYLVLNYCGVG